MKKLCILCILPLMCVGAPSAQDKAYIGEELYKYNPDGNLIYKKYSGGSEIWYKYDKRGNLIYEKDSAGLEIWYKYDRNGNRIYQKDSDGDEWRYEYDRHGNLIYEKDFDGDEWRHEYDRHGNSIRDIWESKDRETTVFVWIREYYPNSSVMKKAARYEYKQ